jgi:peptide deformylase
MAVLPIVTLGSPVLRERSRELSREELLAPTMQTFIDDLIETMVHANGAGLAAPQVANPVRICAIWVKDNPRYPYKPNWPLTVLVNPVLTPLSSEEFVNYEGCLSVPNLRGEVKRFAELRVDAWDRQGNSLSYEVRGLTAGTFQHECDHLDGKVFLDRVFDTTSLATWAEFEKHKLEGFAERARALVKRWGS